MLDRFALAAVALLGLLISAPVAYAQSAHDMDDAVRRAIALLPKRPGDVEIVDMATATKLLRDHLKHVDAFVTTGVEIVYLKKQGPSLQQEMGRPRSDDYVLAGTIWHEMAHIEGNDERGAQRAEQQLWRTFMLQGRVDTAVATRYLALLDRRESR